MPQAPHGSDTSAHTRRYLTLEEACESIGISRVMGWRLQQEQAWPLPDVHIAPNSDGWNATRILQYALDTGRINAQGKRTRAAEGSAAFAAAVVDRSYRGRPRVYLGSTVCSAAWGMNPLGVYHLRRRSNFIPAAVSIGKGFGWEEWDVIEYGLQTGRLDTAKIHLWLERRAADYPKLPEPTWLDRISTAV
jgi:predicted DNA-binding transcriptional regulator AlpA